MSKMWTAIKGWDKPSSENADRCLLFERDIYENQNIQLKYRYYPGRTDKPLPMAVFLHGADTAGDDNESQLSMHDIGTIFAGKSWQEKHPCHILAPQYRIGMHWASPKVTDCLQSLVEFMAERMHADKKRIYLYGYSAGAIGIFSLLKQHPFYYAAAIPICGSTARTNLESLSQTPLWLFHAADDPIVKAGISRMFSGSREHLGSRILYDELKKRNGAELHYTEYPDGEMMGKYGLHPHCSWVLAGQDEKAKEWLFSCQSDLL